MTKRTNPKPLRDYVFDPLMRGFYKTREPESIIPLLVDVVRSRSFCQNQIWVFQEAFEWSRVEFDFGFSIDTFGKASRESLRGKLSDESWEAYENLLERTGYLHREPFTDEEYEEIFV